MSYVVLARKWRPSSFQSLVGQEHVVRALKNGLEHDRLHHAFLFTGTRGVGKTTIARILAKALNCEKGVSATPCEQCSSCQDIAAGCFVDLIEVDAASKTKVDDTRDMLDNVQYAPGRGRYKVYLIDEVHMLSNHSFNALLKTLEEPPSHVKFLLATTDPQKLPVTVLSRCLQFNLKRLNVDEIGHQIKHILNEESIEFEDDCIDLLARAADGSMRDGLSLLDQAIAFGAGSLKTEDVKSMLGTIDQQSVFRIINCLAESDGDGLMVAVAQAAELAADYAKILDQIAFLLQQISLFQYVPAAIDKERLDPNALRLLADKISAEDLQIYYQIVLHGKRDLVLAPDPKSGIEMVLLRMLAFKPLGNSRDNASAAVASATEKTRVSSPRKSASSEVPSATALPAAAPVVTGFTPDIPADAPLDSQWEAIVVAARLKGSSKQLALNSVLLLKEGSKITLGLSLENQNLRTEISEQRLTESLSQSLGVDVKLSFSDQLGSLEAPATREQKKRDSSIESAKQSLLKEPAVQALQKNFDAVLLDNTIEPVQNR